MTGFRNARASCYGRGATVNGDCQIGDFGNVTNGWRPHGGLELIQDFIQRIIEMIRRLRDLQKGSVKRYGQAWVVRNHVLPPLLNTCLAGPDVIQKVVDVGIGGADAEATVERLEKVL